MRRKIVFDKCDVIGGVTVGVYRQRIVSDSESFVGTRYHPLLTSLVKGGGYLHLRVPENVSVWVLKRVHCPLSILVIDTASTPIDISSKRKTEDSL